MNRAEKLREALKFNKHKSLYKMPRLYEHINRVDLWPQAQEAENARLLPLITALAEENEMLRGALEKIAKPYDVTYETNFMAICEYDMQTARQALEAIDRELEKL